MYGTKNISVTITMRKLPYMQPTWPHCLDDEKAAMQPTATGCPDGRESFAFGPASSALVAASTNLSRTGRYSWEDSRFCESRGIKVLSHQHDDNHKI